MAAAHRDGRTVIGYAASGTDFAWMWRKNEAPPGAFVWIGCWDCYPTTPNAYEPLTATIPAQTGSPDPGALTTFSLGYVAFQVFFVDFLAAEQHAPAYETRTAPRRSPTRWPEYGRRSVPAPPVEWRTALFAHEDGSRKLVRWNGVLPSPADPPRRSKNDDARPCRRRTAAADPFYKLEIDRHTCPMRPNETTRAR